MGQKTVNTFNKGLDFDTSFNKYSTSNYLNGENVRLITSVDYNLNGALSSALGNDEWFTFQTSDEYLIGMAEIMEWTIIISAYTGGNRLYRILTSDFVGSKHLNIAAYEIRDGYIGSTGLSYNRYSNVLDTPVQIIPRPENSDLLKLYVIDGKSQMKVINVANTTTNNSELLTKSPTSFDIVDEVEFGAGGILTTLTSGNLKSGRVQYTYQYYNVNGSETVFNPNYSRLVSITNSSESSGTVDYRGSNVDTVTGKGVKVEIYNYSYSPYGKYAKMRVVRIQYSVLNQPPTYTIIADIEPTYYNTVIIDSGQDLGNLTSDEVNYLTRMITPKTIETKNNYLFLGGISEDALDISKDDYNARAYRYDSNGNTYIGTTQFNPYNNLTNDTSNGANQFIFKQSPLATTIGGSGQNINYEFYTESHAIDNLPSDTNTGRQQLDSWPNNNVATLIKGYFRDEIYRFGIVFFNKYGQTSFVKWIDDIRFPLSAFTSYNGITSANDLFVKFNVTIPLLLQNKVNSFQIVRCKRSESDRTIISCGITGHIPKYSSTEAYFIVNDTTTGLRPRYESTETLNKKVLEFITPEYNFNNKSLQNGGRIDLFNAATSSITTDVDGGHYSLYITKISDYATNINTSYLNVNNVASKQYNIDPDNTLVVDGMPIKSLARVKGNTGLNCIKGSTAIVELSSAYTSGANVNPRYSRLRQVTYPYGGASLNAISFNEFIPASEVVYITPGVTQYNDVKAIYGDCNINMFEYNRCIWEDSLGGTDNAGNIMYLPVESTIDFNYVVNQTFNTLYKGGTSAQPFYAMHETPGVYNMNGSITYTQDYSLYTYNSVYSQQSSDKVYIAEPQNYSTNKDFGSRIIRSEYKVNGETSDNWTKFYPNNFKDLDGKHGNLIALYMMNNQLYFFQEKAYGYLPIQEKSVTTTSDGQQTVLGIGGVLDRFDYINTGAGITHLRNLTSTQNAMYFYDTNNNKICSYSGKHDVLSDKLGVGSLVNSIAQNIYNHTQPVTLIHDYLRNEVSFSFFGLNKSLIYSELAQAFVSIDTYNTLDYYKVGNDVFSCDTSSGNGVAKSTKIYKHNVDILSEIPSYYGVDAPVKIAIVVNPNNVVVNRYDVLSFTFNDDLKINTYRCYNSYQDTGAITTDEENFLRRFRTWRTNTMFNASDDTRLKDTYLIVEITYSDGVDRLVVNDIVTTYTPLNLWSNSSAQ